jgi:hypothetical protein
MRGVDVDVGAMRVADDGDIQVRPEYVRDGSSPYKLRMMYGEYERTGE